MLTAFDASRTATRTEAARVGAILAGATEPIAAADAAGRLVEFNPAAERAFRRRRGAVLGRNLGLLFPAAEHARLGRAFRAVLRRGAADGKPVRVRSDAVRADGSTFPAEVSASVAAVPAGGVGRGRGPVLTLFVADVSARREAEERRRAQLAAEAADRAKTQFLAHISHEIRTPLSAMVGFTDLLLDGADEDPEERREHLRAIRRGGEHLTGLIGDVLDLSRIEAGRAEVHRRRCEPHPVIAGVISMLRVRAAEKGLALDFDWAGPVPEAVWTDNHPAAADRGEPGRQRGEVHRPRRGAGDGVAADAGRRRRVRPRRAAGVGGGHRAGRGGGGTGGDLRAVRADPHGGTDARRQRAGAGDQPRVRDAAGRHADGPEQPRPGRHVHPRDRRRPRRPPHPARTDARRPARRRPAPAGAAARAGPPACRNCPAAGSWWPTTGRRTASCSTAPSAGPGPR